MTNIKFRQPILEHGKFSRWHYWGFLEDGFTGIESGISSIARAKETSQQFIGLLDKNDKEIYRYDIVRVEIEQTIGDNAIAIGTVDWMQSDGCWCIDFESQSIGIVAAVEIEVIGNFDENPELIESAQEATA